MERYKRKFKENISSTVERILQDNNITNVTYYSRSFTFGLVILYNPARGNFRDLFPFTIFEYLVDNFLKPSNKTVKLNYLKDLQDQNKWSKKNETFINADKVILINHNNKIKIIK